MVAKKIWTTLMMASVLGAGCGKSPQDMCKIRRDVWTRCGSAIEGKAASAKSDATCAAEISHGDDAKLVSRFEKAASCADGKECGAIAQECDHIILPPSVIQKHALGKISDELKKDVLDLGELGEKFGKDADS